MLEDKNVKYINHLDSFFVLNSVIWVHLTLLDPISSLVKASWPVTGVKKL